MRNVQAWHETWMKIGQCLTPSLSLFLACAITCVKQSFVTHFLQIFPKLSINWLSKGNNADFSVTTKSECF